MRRRALAILAASLLVAAAPPVGDGAHAQPAPRPGASGRNQLGYESPAQAMAALRAKPGVVFTEQRGWTVAEDRADYAVWSFVPSGHPAHPAVVRRRVVERDGAMFVDMQVLCTAKRPACDALLQEFQDLNRAMRRTLR